jgi:PKD repeat protein
MVELTRRTDPKPRVWRLAHTHTVRKDYADAPFAKINKKGTKVWFGSAWGKAWSDVGSQYDVYQINLPSNWYQDLKTGSFPPATGLPATNMPPTASISATPLSGKPPLAVSFTGSGKDTDGTVVSYSWNFGDGSTSNQQNASHTYEVPGSYTATLKVIDNKGATGSAKVTINILKSDTTPPSIPIGVKTVK